MYTRTHTRTHTHTHTLSRSFSLFLSLSLSHSHSLTQVVVLGDGQQLGAVGHVTSPIAASGRRRGGGGEEVQVQLVDLGEAEAVEEFGKRAVAGSEGATKWSCVCVCVCVCVYLSVSAFVFVCVCVHALSCMRASAYVCDARLAYNRAYIDTYIAVYVCMCVCVRVYVCLGGMSGSHAIIHPYFLYN